MPLQTVRERTLTGIDHARLKHLLRSQPAHPLADWLDIADVLPPGPPPDDLVTMGCTLLLAAGAGGEPRRLTLCYPAESDGGRGHVSVLSPVGAALIGTRLGDAVEWRTPDGRLHAGRVRELAVPLEAPSP